MRRLAIDARGRCRGLHLGLPGDAVSSAGNFIEGLPLQKCTECRRVGKSENLRDIVRDTISTVGILRDERGALTPLMLVLFTDIILMTTPRSIISDVCSVRRLSWTR